MCRNIQLAEVDAETGVGCCETTLWAELGGIGSPIECDIEAEVQSVGRQRPLDDRGQLINQQLVAGAVWDAARPASDQGRRTNRCNRNPSSRRYECHKDCQ